MLRMDLVILLDKGQQYSCVWILCSIVVDWMHEILLKSFRFHLIHFVFSIFKTRKCNDVYVRYKNS